MKKAALWTFIVSIPLLTTGCETKNPLKTAFWKSDKSTQQPVAEHQKIDQTQFLAQNTPAQNTPATSSMESEQLYRQGYNLFYGIGVQYNETQGVEMLQRSAQLGNPKAEQLLSRLAEMGYRVDGVELQALHTNTQVDLNSGEHSSVTTPQLAEQTNIITDEEWYYSEPAISSVAPKRSMELQTTDSPTLQAMDAAKTNASSEATIKHSKSIQLTKDEQALLSMQESYYTLQLVAAKDKQGLDAFISNNDLHDNVHIVKKNISGDDWYIALYGNYESKEAAQTAARGLSAQLSPSVEPWVRTLRNVQDDINQNFG